MSPTVFQLSAPDGQVVPHIPPNLISHLDSDFESISSHLRYVLCGDLKVELPIDINFPEDFLSFQPESFLSAHLSASLPGK